MNRCLRPLTCFATLSALALFPMDATARTSQQHQAEKAPAPNKAHDAIKAHDVIKAHEALDARRQRSATTAAKARHARRDVEESKSKNSSDKSSSKPFAPEQASAPQLSGDLAAVRDAITLARKGKTSDATDIQNRITDPVGRKLVEWYILRHSETEANFSRYAAFITNNPDWPSAALLRRRVEAQLWQDRSDASRVHGFTADQPTTAKGKFALARALLAEGDRDGAARLAREAWRSDEFSDRTEADAYDAFRDLLTRDDHRARMDKRIGAKDLAGARRAAQRLGSDELAIVKACGAVREQSKKAQDALDNVSTDNRGDLGYTLCRIQWLLAQNRIDDAAGVTIAALPETMAQQDTDQWWRERRLLSRKLLDLGKFQTAYDVVSPAALPDNPYYRADEIGRAHV